MESVRIMKVICIFEINKKTTIYRKVNPKSNIEFLRTFLAKVINSISLKYQNNIRCKRHVRYGLFKNQ